MLPSLRHTVCFLLIVLMAAHSAWVLAKAPETGIDGEPCVGFLPDIPGTEPLPKIGTDRVRGMEGRGAMCAARAILVKEELRIYRVWNSQRTSTQFGRWWTIAEPRGPVATYQRMHGLCPEWMPLDRVTSCLVKPGATIFIGTTQSVRCAEGDLPATGEVQVYLDTLGVGADAYLSTCTEDRPWP